MSRERAALAGAWLFVVVIGLLTYVFLRDQPFYYDAKGYVAAAHSIPHTGLLNRWFQSDYRSYGYPLFLALDFKIAGWLHLSEVTGVFLLQWPIFVGAAWLTVRALFRSQRLRLLAFVFVAGNPLLVVYTAQALTESISLACILLAVAALGAACRYDGARAIAALCGGAAASSFAVVVRPGNLFVPACYLAAAATIAFATKSRRLRRVMLAAPLVAVAVLVPLIPQVLINERNYNSLSPLPVFNLAGLQTSSGLEMIRYATNVSTCGTARLEFMNPDKPDLTMTTAQALWYYSTSWPQGPETALLHVFSAVDPRPFLTYQHDFGASYERWLQALTVLLLFLAGMGAREVLRRRRLIERAQRTSGLFLGLVTLVSIGIAATSAAEYRFGLIPMTTASLLAAVGLATLRRPSWRQVGLFVATYLFALLVWVTLSDFVLGTSSTWQLCS